MIPARPYHPKDKAKVEVGVQIAQRWILARLRHRQFFSLADLNAAIGELLEQLNNRPLKKMKVSRKELFAALDKPHALPLPQKPFEFAAWKKARVNVDYHIEIEDHSYSVPYRLIHQQVEVRLTASMVEIFLKGTRMACHPRSFQKYQRTTLKEHMPLPHQKYLEWTPSRMLEWAEKTGPSMKALADAIFSTKEHPEQGYRSILGILRLEKHYGQGRLETAAQRALTYRNFSYQAVKRILEKGLDQQTNSQTTPPPALPFHENIRGSEYYQSRQDIQDNQNNQGGNEHVE